MLLFLLDNDIDVAVRQVVQGAGHRCVTAREIGLASATDEAVSIWGDQHRAIVITHDREFIKRRRERTFGLHVWLECADTDAVDITAKHLPEIVTLLDGKDSVVLRVTRERVVYHAGRWE